MTVTKWAFDEMIHAWWFDEGLLAGEYPGHPSPTRAREKFGLLVASGVRTFVDLTTPADQLEPYKQLVSEVAAAENLGLRHLSFPIPDLGVVDNEKYDSICEAIKEARADGVVYLHCWGGVGRTGTVVACWFGRQGADYAEAMARLSDSRAGTRKSHRACPEASVQHAFLERRLARGSCERSTT